MKIKSLAPGYRKGYGPVELTNVYIRLLKEKIILKRLIKITRPSR